MGEKRIHVLSLLFFCNSLAVGQSTPLMKLLDAREPVREIAIQVLSSDDVGNRDLHLPTPIGSWLAAHTAAGGQCPLRLLTDDSAALDGKATVRATGGVTQLRLPDFGKPVATPPGSILILARQAKLLPGGESLFQLRIVRPTDPRFLRLLRQIGFERDRLSGGMFALLRNAKADDALGSSQLQLFLRKFDDIKARGFVQTQRRGSTGIGYTFETLMGLKENNNPTGDFLGMELKAYRDDEGALDDTEKMNLFLKEPEWLDGLRGAERIQKYGYQDRNGRTALYSTVTTAENSHGFRFRIDKPNRKLQLLFKSGPVGEWTFATLQNRLTEKHSQVAFVAAESRGVAANEQFRYHSVTWCAQPAVNELLRLIQSRRAMLELRMHVKESGAARNHGTAFRVQKNRLTELYAATVRCRVDKLQPRRRTDINEP